MFCVTPPSYLPVSPHLTSPKLTVVFCSPTETHHSSHGAHQLSFFLSSMANRNLLSEHCVSNLTMKQTPRSKSQRTRELSQDRQLELGQNHQNPGQVGMSQPQWSILAIDYAEVNMFLEKPAPAWKRWWYAGKHREHHQGNTPRGSQVVCWGTDRVPGHRSMFSFLL